MTNNDFDKYFPLLGTCFHCGRDLRFHTIMKINERFGSGESIDKLAFEYKVPVEAIKQAINYNSIKPLGRTFAAIIGRNVSA